MHTKEVARRLGLLPQTSIAPEGISVADLVSRGRFPHQRVLRQWSKDDADAVAEAMRCVGVTELSSRMVDELSGGQRQRVWVAVVLAQQTPLILLDEPTTYLDIAHQVELLDLFAMLNAEQQPHDRRGAARPQPCMPVRRPDHRHEERRYCRAGRSEVGHHRGSRRGRLRAQVPDHRRSPDRNAAGDTARISTRATATRDGGRLGRSPGPPPACR